MGRVIFVTAFKGGVGKTTVSAGIACALAALGKRVCIVDADFGMRCMDLVLGMADYAMYDCSDVLQGNCTVTDALLPVNDCEGLWFLPAPIRYDGAMPDRERALNMIAYLKERFDFCILDSSAELTPYYRLFADLADDAIVVTLHQSVAIRAAEKTAAHLASFGHRRVHLVVNCFSEEKAKSRKLPTLPDIIFRSSVPLIGVVPRSDRLPEDQEAVSLALSGEPNRRLADYEAAFLNIACRMCGLEIPLWKGVSFPKRKGSALRAREKELLKQRRNADRWSEEGKEGTSV